MMSNFPITITLRKPIVYGNETVKSLTFGREPIARDFYEMPVLSGQYRLADFAVVAAKLTGSPEPLIEQLSLGDFNACMGVVNEYFLDSLGTGEES
jgi:hypothetical protein